MAEKDKKVDSDIKKDLDKIRSDVDKMTKQNSGYGVFTKENVINTDITELNLKNTNVNGVNVIQDSILNLKGKDKSTGYRVSDELYVHFYSNRESLYEDLERELRPRRERNLVYNYILSNMIEMKTVLSQLADDCVFPTSAIKSGLNINFTYFNDSIPGERKEDLEKYFRPNNDITSTIKSKRLYNFDIEKFTKELIMDVATFGYQIVATIPYKSIASDILYQVEEEESRYGKIKGVNKYGENYAITDERAFSESCINYLENRISTNTKIPIFESENTSGLENFISEVPYSISDIDSLNIIMRKEGFDVINDEDVKAFGSKISIGTSAYDLVTRGEADNSNALVNELESLKAKRTKKFSIDKMKGSTLEKLDVNKIQPIFIKDELIGVYVIDNIPDSDLIKLGPNTSNAMNTNIFDDGLNDEGYNRRVKDLLINDIKVLLQGNIDKSFLRNNPNLIEDIEWILNTYDANELLHNRIRFIPAEYLTLFKHGPGPLGRSMLEDSRTYALMYIQVNNSEAMNKVFYNKPRMKVSVTDTDNVNSGTTINDAIEMTRASLPRMSDIGIPDIMTDDILSAYQTVIVHRTHDDREVINIDQIPIPDPKDNTDYLRQLRNQATIPIGYPADALDPSQNMDFAKKISNINIYTLLKVLSIQNDITVSLSELCSKRLNYIMGDEKFGVEVTFTTPKDIDDLSVMAALDNVTRKIESYEMMIEANPEIRPEEKDVMKARLAKKLLSEYLDMDILDDLHKEVIVEGRGEI